jgi:hypothetical protein
MRSEIEFAREMNARLRSGVREYQNVIKISCQKTDNTSLQYFARYPIVDVAPDPGRGAD